MRTTTLLMYLGLTAPTLLAQDPTTPPAATVDPVPPPYVARLAALDEGAATRLRTALGELPGVDAVETSPGDQPAAQIRMRPGQYISQAQVDAVVRRQGLVLDDFDVPPWARLRVYVVEASGGG